MNRMMTHMQPRCGGDETQESAEIRSLRQYNALLAELEMLADDERYENLWFDFRHITDELVFYGMRAQTSHLVSPLANLCYKMLYRHDVFDSFLEFGDSSTDAYSAARRARCRNGCSAGSSSSHFLMHFPDVYIEPLRRLEKTLKRHSRWGTTSSCRQPTRRRLRSCHPTRRAPSPSAAVSVCAAGEDDAVPRL